MPTDSGSSRRSFRKISTEEESEVRRARGEISCAECRRLKLRCDKKLPCSSCVRRGCPSVCPNGTLTTGHGTRYILADTAQLHQKIAEMGERIRQLEDALALLQASVSKEEHPLLTVGKQLLIKFGPEVQDIHHPAEARTPDQGGEVTAHTLNALGTLTIDDRGHSQYFGTSAGTEALLSAGLDSDSNAGETQDITEELPKPEILHLSHTFPLNVSSPWDGDRTLAALYDALPPQPRAWSLCETYWQHASCLFRPVQRDELIDEILIPVYKLAKDEDGHLRTDIVSVHKLAILFFVFSIGSLLDLTLPPYSPEAETFLHCGKCALSLRFIFDSPELATVQAVALLGFYHTMGGANYSMDTAWGWCGLSHKLAQSIGLHRDPARWSLDAKTVQRRRILFWELHYHDSMYSLAMGRPPATRFSYVDCEFPVDEEEFLDENGDRQPGFYTWKREFTRDITSRIVEECLSAQPSSYQAILDWDRKCREKPMPSHLNKTFRTDEVVDIPQYMKGVTARWYKIQTVLFMHKSYFTQAMLDHPVEPLRSPYAPSFLAACRCASLIIQLVETQFRRYPTYAARLWNNWAHLFTASTIISMLVSRFPSSSMAPSAFAELGIAIDLFTTHASSCSRARNGLVLLTRMKAKALESYSQFSAGSPLKPFSIENDDLAIFGGQTRVLVSKRMSSQTSKGGRRRVPTPSSSAEYLDVDSYSTPSDRDSQSGGHGTNLPMKRRSSDENLMHEERSMAPQFYTNPARGGGFSQQSQSQSMEMPAYNYFGEYSGQEAAVPDWASPSLSYGQPAPRLHPGHVPPIPGPMAMGCEILGEELPNEAAQVGFAMMNETGLQNEQWVEFMRQTGLLGSEPMR